MSDPSDETTENDVIPAPNINWKMVGLGLFSLLIFGLIAQNNTLEAIALCALVVVGILASR